MHQIARINILNLGDIMSNQDTIQKAIEATEIIELSCSMLDELAKSFDCIAHVARNGQLTLVEQDARELELLN